MKTNLKAEEYAKYFPILAIQNDVIISKTGEITVGFELSLPPIFTQNQKTYDDTFSILSSAIKLLPDNTIIHKQDLFMYNEYKPVDSEKEKGFLAQAFDRHFQGRRYLTHKCYIFLTKPVNDRATRYSTFSILTRRKITLSTIEEKEIHNFLSCIEQFTAIINNSMSLRRIYREEYLQEILPRYQSLGSEIGYSSVALSGDKYQYGDKHLLSYTITNIEDLPKNYNPEVRVDKYSTSASDVYLSLGSAIGIQLPIEHIVNQYIYLEKQATVIQKLEQKARFLTAFSKASRKNKVMADELDTYLKEVAKDSTHIVRTHINVQAWSEKNELKSIKNIVTSGIDRLGVKPVYNIYNTPILYWAGIPGNAADIGYEDYFQISLETAVNLMPLESFSFSLGNNTTKLIDRLRNIPINLDLADQAYKDGLIENYNKFVLGPSGSGKSFLTNFIARQYYDEGCHIFIIDAGNSYEGLCSIIKEESKGEDGIYYTYSAEQPMSFNPFYSKAKKYDIEKHNFLSSLLTTLWKKDGNTTPAELSIISRSIELFIQKIEKSDAVLTFNDYYEFFKEEYITDKALREKDFDSENYLLVLEQFYKGGMYDYLLNSSAPIDLLSKRFIVFEIDKIRDNAVLFPIITLMLMDIFVDKMTNIDSRKVMIIEEAWKAISNKQMADYILWLWKTARKHRAEAIVVTQEVEDIIKSDIVKNSIINNSAIKILLDQKKFKNKFDDIAALLALSPEDKDQILSINRNNNPLFKYKEAWVSIGDNLNAVYAIEGSPEEFWAYQTNKPEKIVLKKHVEQTGSYIAAITELTKRR